MKSSSHSSPKDSPHGYAKLVRAFAVLAEENALPKHPPRDKLSESQIDFIIAMVTDELGELRAAKTLTDQSDALVDAIYYIIHFATKAGINLDTIFAIVHEANMKKVRNGVKRRSDGKILKPDNWQGPEREISAELERQRRFSAFKLASPSPQ